MKILAFAASNSSTSINRRLIGHVVSSFSDNEIEIPDLSDYEMPIYSSDRQKNEGIPQLAYDFKNLIKTADKIIISFAEHNGSYSVAFKNVMDWISRIDGDTWESKAFLLLSTSPGKRGGQTVLNTAVNSFKHMGANIIGHFALPSFHSNFDDVKGILDEELSTCLAAHIDNLKLYR